MGGWHVLEWCAVCGAGVLLFLKLVADETEFAGDCLRHLEDRERKACEKRREAQAGSQVPTAAFAA